VKTCHYTHPTAHCFTTDHPRGRIRQGPYPTISEIRPYPPSLDPASTRPRRPPPVSKKERPTWHMTQGLFTVPSPTSPRCPGMTSHSWGTLLLPPPQGSTKLHLKTPRRPGLLLPYKRVGQGSTKGNGESKVPSQKPNTGEQRHTTQRSISQAITLVLFFFL
jgi:hypothetical protein